MELHWGWLIGIYLFLGGLGAGAFLFSFAAEKGLLGEASSLSKFGYYVSAPLVAIGAGLLVFDLGQGLHKPWLIIGMFFNFSSVMTWGIYILSAFIGVGLLRAYFAWKDKKAPEILGLAGAVLALATCAYTGLLLAVVKAVPFWNFYLMPVIFVVSALSTGLSLNSILAHLFEKKELKEGKACETHLVLVGIEIILLAIFFGFILMGIKGPVALASANKILFGELSLVFWVVLVGMGLVGPFFLYVYNLNRMRSRVRIEDLGLRTENILVPAASTMEEAATNHRAVHAGSNTLAICLCDAAVMIGGLSLRCLIVFAAIPVWNGMIG
jgi:polysulfide reductase chain C